MSLDQALFAWVKGALSGITSSGGADVSVLREDYGPSELDEPPRIVCERFTESVKTAGSAKIHTGLLALRADANRSDAFGDADTPEAEGDLHNLLDQIDTILAYTRPTIAGYACMKLEPVRESPGDGEPQIAARTLRYRFTAVVGMLGVPLAGDEGSLELAGYNGVVEQWFVNDRAPLNADMTATDDDHPEYSMGDSVASIRIRFMPQQNDTPLPAKGEVVATFTYADSISWSDTLLIHDRRHRVSPGASELVGLEMTAEVVNDDSPFHTGAIA